MHYLVLSGRASWDEPRDALRDERAFLRDWLATGRVQTNEVQRCWWLLPCFLEVARRTGAGSFDCLELGCSAGLNLLWDRYGYRYANGSRRPSDRPTLTGEERGRVPAALLERAPVVAARVGVDLAPPDLRSDDGVRLLKSYVWPGMEARFALLDAAVEVWRDDPPEIVRGDLVDELPALLGRPPRGDVLLVWATASLGYLEAERREEVRRLLRESERPLAVVSTRQPQDGSPDHYGLYVDSDEVALGDFHGAWLDWRG